MTYCLVFFSMEEEKVRDYFEKSYLEFIAYFYYVDQWHRERNFELAEAVLHSVLAALCFPLAMSKSYVSSDVALNGFLDMDGMWTDCVCRHLNQVFWRAACGTK